MVTCKYGQRQRGLNQIATVHHYKFQKESKILKGNFFLKNFDVDSFLNCINIYENIKA